jgi:hypothetical protein
LKSFKLIVSNFGTKCAAVAATIFWEQEVITMNNCHVYHPERTQADQVAILDFSGNKPAVPPLTTEAVTTIIYEVDEEEPMN